MKSAYAYISRDTKIGCNPHTYSLSFVMKMPCNTHLLGERDPMKNEDTTRQMHSFYSSRTYHATRIWYWPCRSIRRGVRRIFISRESPSSIPNAGSVKSSGWQKTAVVPSSRNSRFLSRRYRITAILIVHWKGGEAGMSCGKCAFDENQGAPPWGAEDTVSVRSFDFRELQTRGARKNSTEESSTS